MSRSSASTPDRSPVLNGFDVEAEVRDACTFLQERLATLPGGRYVIGLSGGIDSAVVATLATRAVGPDHLLLVRMPYGIEGGTRTRFSGSAVASLADAQLMMNALPYIANATVDIGPKVDATVRSMEQAATALAHYSESLPNRWPTVTTSADAPLLGNLKARARADVLRCLANQYRGLVLGTENRTENLLGYMTIGGDEESDLEVLTPFLKTQVRALATHLGVPQAILDKAPSADLWAGQTDEGELGFSYAQADLVFWMARHFNGYAGPVARAQLPGMTGLPAEVVTRVLDRYEATAFKRDPRPTYVSPRLPSHL
jgi:NAD+ synthetase